MAEKNRLRPKPAASLIIVDTASSSPRVFMGKRSDGHVFMPGYHVFPGGALEPEDRAGENALDDDDAARVASTFPSGRQNPHQAQALARAAIRELKEETGFDLVFGSRLKPVGRAITPPGQVRRYDTHFFYAPATNMQKLDTQPDSELLEIGFVPIPIEQTYKLHFITKRMLKAALDLIELDFTGPLTCVRHRSGKMLEERW